MDMMCYEITLIAILQSLLVFHSPATFYKLSLYTDCLAITAEYISNLWTTTSLFVAEDLL
jgi:hypothetical protein